MRLSSNKQLAYIIVSCLLILKTYPQTWTHFNQANDLIPDGVPQFSMNIGDTINIKTYLFPEPDTDTGYTTIYLYKQYYQGDIVYWGHPYYYDGYNTMDVSQTVSQSGLYTVSIVASNLVMPITPYKVEVFVNNILIVQSYGSTITNTVRRHIKALQVNENSCTLRFTYDGPILPLKIFSPGQNLTDPATVPFYANETSQNPRTFIININQPGQWVFEICQDLRIQFFDYFKYSLIIETDEDNKCTNYCSDKIGTLGWQFGRTDICKCQSNFYKNPNIGGCVRSDCSSIEGSTGFSTTDADKCECDANYYQNPFFGCGPIDCGSIDRASFSQSSANECTCQNQYIWNSTTNQCQIQYNQSAVNCSSLPYSVGNVEDGVSCKCKGKFYWNQSQQQCMINCTRLRDTLGPVEGIVDQCICRDLLIWSEKNKVCRIVITPANLGLRIGAFIISFMTLIYTVIVAKQKAAASAQVAVSALNI